jgi:hypothetical protein
MPGPEPGRSPDSTDSGQRGIHVGGRPPILVAPRAIFWDANGRAVSCGHGSRRTASDIAALPVAIWPLPRTAETSSEMAKRPPTVEARCRTFQWGFLYCLTCP